MGLYSDYIFPKFYDVVVQHKSFDALRENFLNSVEGNILEIGIGTGLNLDLYPERVTEITAIDPNPGMERELKRKLTGYAAAKILGCSPNAAYRNWKDLEEAGWDGAVYKPA